jgi:prolyl-tRNA synthetase
MGKKKKQQSFFMKQSEDFSRWYTDVVQKADLADYSSIKGCMVIKPYGYALWENIQRELDRRIKEAGVSNVYFPLFIPESFLNKEKEHVEGFAVEAAVVTHGGGEKLAEPLYIRPTSETIMYDTFSKWIQSYRDLPLMINQWANIVRWEKRTRLFLRTMEFLWQEGHTAHETFEDAEAETIRAGRMYESFDRDYLAIPVILGQKSESEKFKGAYRTLTTEALAKDMKAIQAGTSHNLGQNFSEAFKIEYLDQNNEMQKVWQTSWGVSTRIVGTLIVVHGDDKGLVLPPRAAPTQVVFVPIYKSNEQREEVLSKINEMDKTFKEKGVRTYIDDRDNLTPGFKFNEWEFKGVPVRIELGPKDLEKEQCVLAIRYSGEKKFLPSNKVKSEIIDILDDIHNGLLENAERFLKEHILETDNYKEFTDYIDAGKGMVLAKWCGDEVCEHKIKDDCKASSRCIPINEEGKIIEISEGKCIACGKPAKYNVYWSKAY